MGPPSDNDENEASSHADANNNGPTGATLHLSSKGRKKRSKGESQSSATSTTAAAATQEASPTTATTTAPQSQERGRSTTNNKSSFLRSLSRSLSRSRSTNNNGYSTLPDDPNFLNSNPNSEILITVTSCRSDAYHENRAPGSTVKLPRRAPSALKTFHELALAVKDAYVAGGCVPAKPRVDTNGGNGDGNGDGVVNNDMKSQQILYDFFINLDFLLALVNEVAIDTATRGALKEESTFRGLRDVIKKCNRVLEGMLVRRERKYMLMIRIVNVNTATSSSGEGDGINSHDRKMLKKMDHWNMRVEKALGGVTASDNNNLHEDSSLSGSSRRSGGNSYMDDTSSDAGSEFSSVSTASSRSSTMGDILRRGRELLPSAGKVRARRATPTPRLRRKNRKGDAGSGSESDAGEDGYASETASLDNLAELQLSLDMGRSSNLAPGVPTVMSQLKNDKRGGGKNKDYSLQGMVQGGNQLVQPMKPKDELLDVIRGLRSEQMRAREAVGSDSELEHGADAMNPLDEIKSNFTPKAEIPAAVPKLPIEYIHRHRLMKQVVNCLLDRGGGTGPRDTDTEDMNPFANTITCITSRHSDKAGNGKTTLAVAAIQTVEVREFFSDGIAWIHLGRVALGEREIRRLYEQLYDQLLGAEEDDEEEDGKEEDEEDDDSSEDDDENGEKKEENKRSIIASTRGESNVSSALSEMKLAKSRRFFQGGELEGMKEDLGRLLLTRKVLICLDDVCRMEDAKWFLFGTRSDGDNTFEDTPHRVLITTRIPGLVGPSITHEVFVRIFSEHEAVKLVLTAAGRRPNGLPKVSPVFAQARIIVKGCGNSPLALRIAGGMLRSRNRNWTLSSPAWKLLVEQCRTSLEEASKIRSFANSVQRLIDLSFATVQDVNFRACLRRCFVAFAMVFHDTDSLKVGKGISRAVVLRLFAIVSSMENGRPKSQISPEDMTELMEDATLILDTLETMNLVQRAGHELSKKSTASTKLRNSTANGESNVSSSDNHRCYSMHESVKAIAEEMAKRKTEAFAPIYDEFNSFVSKSEQIPNASTYPLQFDECMVMMLTGQLSTMAELTQLSLYDRWNVEEYITENIPLHLIRAKMLKRASEFLVDSDFCRRRVVALGSIEAARRHVSDLIDLRRAHASKNTGKSSGDWGFDIVETIQNGSSCIIDEVVQQSDGANKVNVAICLSTMGEGLAKARQPKEASQRLEEAADLYRELLGQVDIDVARAVNAVAKSLVKLGETRQALIRFGEASSAYEDCNSSHHFDSIANLQGMANLFVTSGDFQAATALYENVISRKRSVHGDNSVATAKTINDYAVILAKNGKMNEALTRYEMARATYEAALNGLPPSMSWLNHGESAAKCGFDMALINLNIASIKSKKGDTDGAISSYEMGVQGLRKYKEDLDMAGDEAGKNKNSSHMRHLVSALGRIGSLKLKLGDRNGALEAYAALFGEVDNDSPMPSRLEKAKAHIKCATIYRQSGEREDNKHAILHLREALNMYTELYGPKHKDTVAVATSLGQWMDEEQNSLR